MIVVDTNIVSELMRPRPASAVLVWMATHDEHHLFLNAVSEAELRAGVAVMPEGRRKRALAAQVDGVASEDFAGRVLPFDSAAAKAFAAISAERRSAGRPISDADCQIAAIVRANNATLATRNTTNFEGCGIDLVDPWKPPTGAG